MSITDPLPSSYNAPYARVHVCRSVSWGAILAGLTAAIALQVLFMLLGAGLGFAIYSPLTDENPVADLGKGAIIIQGISAVVSLWFGGWVAGRFTPIGVRRAGWLHGFLVWSGATVAGVLLVAGGAGWLLGDLSKLVGGGLSAAGKPLAAITSEATNLAKDALAQSNNSLSSFTDESLGGMRAGATAADRVRAKREISLAIARVFTPGEDALMPEKRAALVKVLAEQTALSQSEADHLVREWTDSYNQLRQDLAAAKEKAEIKARQLADDAADRLALFCLCTFVAFALGALAGSCGGSHGARCATRCEDKEGVLVA